jgi:hypothetical protein
MFQTHARAFSLERNLVLLWQYLIVNLLCTLVMEHISPSLLCAAADVLFPFNGWHGTKFVHALV